MASTQPGGPAQQDSDDVPDGADIRPLIHAAGGGGCLLIALYALRFRTTGDALSIFGVAVLVGAAAFAVGVLAGFLFGIPRESAPPKAGDLGEAQPPATEIANPIASNTNLVEISDWLTKIIVGVGLVELKSILRNLGTLSYFIGRSLQPAQCGAKPDCADMILGGQSAALAIMIFYCALGFLWGYVWMKLIFQRNLEDRYRKLHADFIVLSKEKEAVLQEKEAVVQENAAFIAEKLIVQDRLDEAMKKIDEALAKNPDDGGAILTKGRIFKRQAEKLHGAERQALWRQALAYAERAIDVMPAETKAEPTYNKACYQELLGVDKREVLSTLQTAFQLNPGLRNIARTDDDLKKLWHDSEFKRLTEDTPPQETQGS